jgi:fructokinase
MILVCGEALIDLFVGENDDGTLVAHPIAGGSPFNVALGLARLEAPVGFLSGLSTDRFGRFLLEALAREGVETRFVKRSEKPTPLVVVSPDAAGQPSYLFHAHDCAERDLEPADLPAPAEPFQAIAFGSYALAVEPIGSSLLALAEREAGRMVISLDPNLRPSVVGDLDAWRQRFARFVKTATILKLSREDLTTAHGADADPAQWAGRWLADGVRLVVVTDGEQGATAYYGRGALHRPARKITMADTVGAGDTFHAALLARLAEKGLLSRAAIGALDTVAVADLLDYAGLAASITCTRKGADLPRRAEVEEGLHVSGS